MFICRIVAWKQNKIFCRSQTSIKIKSNRDYQSNKENLLFHSSALKPITEAFCWTFPNCISTTQHNKPYHKTCRNRHHKQSLTIATWLRVSSTSIRFNREEKKKEVFPSGVDFVAWNPWELFPHIRKPINLSQI